MRLVQPRLQEVLWSEGREALRCERIFGGQGNVSYGPKLQNNLSVAAFQWVGECHNL